jgi:hypothetical protein
VHQPDFGRKGFDDVDRFLQVSLLNIHIPWVMRFTYSLPVRPFFLFVSRPWEIKYSPGVDM